MDNDKRTIQAVYDPRIPVDQRDKIKLPSVVLAEESGVGRLSYLFQRGIFEPERDEPNLRNAGIIDAPAATMALPGFTPLYGHRIFGVAGYMKTTTMGRYQNSAFGWSLIFEWDPRHNPQRAMTLLLDAQDPSFPTLGLRQELVIPALFACGGMALPAGLDQKDGNTAARWLDLIGDAQQSMIPDLLHALYWSWAFGPAAPDELAESAHDEGIVLSDAHKGLARRFFLLLDEGRQDAFLSTPHLWSALLTLLPDASRRLWQQGNGRDDGDLSDLERSLLPLAHCTSTPPAPLLRGLHVPGSLKDLAALYQRWRGKLDEGQGEGGVTPLLFSDPETRSPRKPSTSPDGPVPSDSPKTRGGGKGAAPVDLQRRQQVRPRPDARRVRHIEQFYGRRVAEEHQALPFLLVPGDGFGAYLDSEMDHLRASMDTLEGLPWDDFCLDASSFVRAQWAQQMEGGIIDPTQEPEQLWIRVTAGAEFLARQRDLSPWWTENGVYPREDEYGPIPDPRTAVILEVTTAVVGKVRAQQPDIVIIPAGSPWDTLSYGLRPARATIEADDDVVAHMLDRAHLALATLAYLYQTDDYLVEVKATMTPMEEKSNEKSIKKRPDLRLDLGRYILIDPMRAAEDYGAGKSEKDPSAPVEGEHRAVKPHRRRGHWRHLYSDYWKIKRRIRIATQWIGPAAWSYEGSRYRIIGPIAARMARDGDQVMRVQMQQSGGDNAG